MSDITTWLEQLGLGRYIQTFIDNDISFLALPELTEEDLMELGLSLGHRRILQRAITNLATDAQRDHVEQAEIEASPAGEAQRRQLTILFCDLVGSTELSRRLDPEELGIIIRAFQERCSAVIMDNKGYVARYMGDGLLAYFGYPVAHEDAVERAIRAGLKVVSGMKELNNSISIDIHPGLAVRVGIATGPVVVGDLIGDGAAQENAVVGETPNLAARLQNVAAPDSVVVASKTRELAGKLFEYEDGEKHALKGMAAPVQVWTVVGEAVVESRFDAMHASALTPMIGRQQEIALLLDRWEQAREGDGQVVLLSGEAGIGKSRVAKTLRQEIDDDKLFRLRYQCSAYHTSSALRPFISQLEWAAHINRDDQTEARLDKLESLLAQSSDDVAMIMPLFASLLSIPYENRYPALGIAPELQKEKTLDALVTQMEGLARQHPVLLLFEDAHWADPTSLELLGSIIEQAQGNRVLVLITFRSEFTSPWTDYTHITALTLNRFNRGRVIIMMDEVTAGKTLPTEVQDHIIEKTDGIPLFVEELTKTVIESNLLEDRGDHYVLTGPLPALSIPNTLQDSLMARLDRIAAVKETAQIASVIGREFSHRLLSQVSPLPDTELDHALEQLKDAALVFSSGAPPQTRYVFKHAMVQDAAYEGLLKSRRRQIHARVAKVLEDDLQVTEPEILAHHYSEAGLFKPAVEYWLQAGRVALQRSANIEATTHLRKGLDLLENLPASTDRQNQELALLLALGPSLMAIKGYAAPEIEQVYVGARELCSEVGDSSKAFAATWGLWLHYQQAGQLNKARDLTEDVLNIAGQQNDQALLLQAHHAAWATYHRLGELKACRYHAERGASLYDTELHGTQAYLYGGHDPGVCAETHLGMAMWCLGYPDAALARTLNGLKLSEPLAHPFSVTDALYGMVRIHLFRREYQLAKCRVEEMLTLSRQHGFSLMEAFGTVMHGYVEVNTGDMDSQVWIDKMSRGIAFTQDTGAQAHVPYLISLLADANLQSGLTGSGLRAVDDALQVIELTGEKNWLAEIYRLQGELLLLHSEAAPAQAERCFQQAVEMADSQGARSLQLRALMSMVRLRRTEDDSDTALNLLMPLYQKFTEGFETLDLVEAKKLCS